MSWILYVEVLKEMVMAQTKFGWWEFCHFSLEIIGLVNSGKTCFQQRTLMLIMELSK
jgi:hypothetical protein